MAEVRNLVAELEEARNGFDALGVKLVGLIEEVLLDHELPVHSVTYRVKDRMSFRRKVRANPDRYQHLAAVTDCLGVRVITYFPSDVDRVATAIEQEFAIDPHNSTDKRKALAPDAFGYLSLHYVGSLSRERLRLLEYKRFASSVFEIQIRSILQHAWAEIEHDIGYKTSTALPQNLRRRFSQIAGLLEVADEGFDEIRSELRTYEKQVEQTLQEDPAEVFVDQASLASFVRSSPIVAELDLVLAHAAGDAALSTTTEQGFGRMSGELQHFGLAKIDDVRVALENRKGLVEAFARAWMARESVRESINSDERPLVTDESGEVIRGPYFGEGISLFYLCYVLGAETGSPEVLAGYLDAFAIGGDMDRVDLTRDVIETYRAIAPTDTS